MAKGAAWAAPVLTVAGLAPQVAATTIRPKLQTDLRVRRELSLNRDIPFYIDFAPRIPYHPPTDQTVTWLLTIVQTAGNKGADTVPFKTSDNDEGRSFDLSDPATSTNEQGYKVTTQILTLYAGFDPAPLSGDSWIRISAEYPPTGSGGESQNRGAQWAASIFANFDDLDNGNNSVTTQLG